MILNLHDRLTLLGVLPQEGNFATLKILRNLQMNLAPSEEEVKKFEIKVDNTMTLWNPNVDTDTEINIGEKATDLIVESLKKLDKDGKLTARHFNLYEKFVGE